MLAVIRGYFRKPYNTISNMSLKTNFMSLKRLFTLFFLLLASIFVKGQSKNVGIGTLNPDPSSILDLTDTAKGLLIPRVSLQSVNDITTIANPALSLLVYNINPAISGGNGAGFYYWNGIQWVQAIGPAGPQGPAGVNGATGTTGAIGPTGIQGIQGPTGVDGVTGPQGMQGATGATGPNGTTVLPGIGTTQPLLVINGGGITYKNTPLEGLILIDTNNQCWKLSADTLGNLTTISVTCP